MRDRRIMAVVGVLALILIAAPGCVSSKKFRSNIGDTDSRLAAVENAVEATDKKFVGFKKETDQKLQATQKQAGDAAALSNKAFTKAEGAEKAAQGKLLWTVTISNDQVKFPFGRTELGSSAIAVLDQLLAKIKGYGKAVYLEIEGHTDNVGSDAFNLRLSEKRAQAVLTYLNQNGGIPLHAISTIGLGESKPIADNSSTAGRAQNRRVVVRVLE